MLGKNYIFAGVGTVLVLAVAAFFMFSGGEDQANSVRAIQPAAGSEAQASAGAPAQSGPPWDIRCEPAPEGEAEEAAKRGRCEIYQKLSLAQTGQRVVEMAVGFPSDQENARGIVILPLGMLLEDGVSMKIDDKQAFKFAVRYCDNGGCFAFLNLKDEILQMFRAGDKANVTFKASNGQPISIDLVLDGFDEAINEVI